MCRFGEFCELIDMVNVSFIVKNRLLAGAGLSLFVLAMTAKDSVIMTVNGEDVPKSEFEYLYHKNSQQQLSPQTLGEYAEMFKLYKLKVADAKAEGIDTTASFRKEMEQYRKELAAPYIADSVFLDKLIEEAAEREREEVETSHIMLFKTRSAALNRISRQRIDSIRQALLDGADFVEMASKYTQDKSMSSPGGYLGYVKANTFPYLFETAVYTTPEGEISEVVESPAGYHIVKTGNRRPAKGRVRASHIMKMVKKDATEEEKARIKHEIDSIHAFVIANPDSFSEVARTESEDPGSARNGGDLSWFGSGEMVPEFENAAFALEDGGISEPVRSVYGWHIIKRTGTKGPRDASELREMLLKRMESPQDDRYRIIRDHQTARLAEKHGASMVVPTVQEMRRMIAAGGMDSVFWGNLSSVPFRDSALFVVDGKEIPVKDYAGYVGRMNMSDAEDALEAFDTSLDLFFNSCLIDAEEDWLYSNVPSYHNLMKEYHDGSLLYEISLRKVWDKASKDKAGLEDYFRKHRGKYKWEHPHVKGILVQVTNDSIGTLVRERMKSIPEDSIPQVLRKEFRGKIKVDRILVEQGDNAMVDHLMYGGPEAKPSSDKFTNYFLYNERVLDAPEEASDVKSLVTADYQAALESAWIKELRRRYKVKVNKKELNSVK